MRARNRRDPPFATRAEKGAYGRAIRDEVGRCVPRRSEGRRLAEARARCLRPGDARHRLHHRHGHLRAHRRRCGGACRAGRQRLVRDRGRDLHSRRALLLRIRDDDPHLGQRLQLRVRDARRAGRVDHRLGSRARVRARGECGGSRLVGLCGEPARRIQDSVARIDRGIARRRRRRGLQPACGAHPARDHLATRRRHPRERDDERDHRRRSSCSWCSS